MEDQLIRFLLKAEWILDYDGNELDYSTINKFYVFSENEWLKKTRWYCDTPARKLTLSEISLAIKHIIIYQKIVKENYPVALVLEDDAILVDDFMTRFNNVFNRFIEFDFVFIGSGCNLRLPLEDGKVLYKKGHPASKCTDSYCISLKAARNLLMGILPFTMPIDFELNYQMMIYDMDVYWVEPPMISQGSQTGRFSPSISH